MAPLAALIERLGRRRPDLRRLLLGRAGCAASGGSAGGRVCTSMGRTLDHRRPARPRWPGGCRRFGADCVQVPTAQWGVRIVDRAFVRPAHRGGAAGPRLDHRRPSHHGAAAGPRRGRDHVRPADPAPRGASGARPSGPGRRWVARGIRTLDLLIHSQPLWDDGSSPIQYERLISRFLVSFAADHSGHKAEVTACPPCPSPASPSVSRSVRSPRARGARHPRLGRHRTRGAVPVQSRGRHHPRQATLSAPRPGPKLARVERAMVLTSPATEPY